MLYVLEDDQRDLIAGVDDWSGERRDGSVTLANDMGYIAGIVRAAPYGADRHFLVIVYGQEESLEGFWRQLRRSHPQ